MNPAHDASGDAAAPSFDERLSALMDGHGDDGQLLDACRQWRVKAEVRQTWHTYQLIGDVLRTEDLASTPARDAAFLATLRTRLAEEPVPLAPEPLPTLQVRHRRWLPPVAAVAGFVAVGAAVVVLRPEFAPRALDDSAPMASVEPIAGAAIVNPVGGLPPSFRVDAVARPASGQSILILDHQSAREARLEVYFEAHRGALGPVPVALPGGALRPVDDRQPLR